MTDDKLTTLHEDFVKEQNASRHHEEFIKRLQRKLLFVTKVSSSLGVPLQLYYFMYVIFTFCSRNFYK